MSEIPDFDENELRIVQNVVNERYGKEVGLQMADSEVKVDPQSEELSWCPTVFWAEMGTSFVVLKIGNNKYRNMFYYQPNEQFGTGRDSYDNLEGCVATLLKLQADHEKDMAGATSGKTGKDLN